jgi:hypothetical protein
LVDITWSTEAHILRATPKSTENWPLKRGGLSSGVQFAAIYLKSGLSAGVDIATERPLKALSKVLLYSHI